MENDYQYLLRHREIWSRKPVLRRIYSEQFYAPLLSYCKDGGRTLEIGSGPGLLAEVAPEVIRTDILPSPWIDCASDVHHLPFGSNSMTNVIGLDVLHHFQKPRSVLKEIARILESGGRFVLVEPWITPFSRFIYTYLHQETVQMSARPWLDNPEMFDENKQAFDGNAAIPYLLINHNHKVWEPELRLVMVERFSSLTYLLSGGFKPFNLLPFYDVLYALEKATQPVWERWLAMRAILVWERV